jgi:hypothetical protein
LILVQAPAKQIEFFRSVHTSNPFLSDCRAMLLPEVVEPWSPGEMPAGFPDKGTLHLSRFRTERLSSP